MKQIFGVKLAGSFTRSRRWIAANRKSEPAVYGLQAKIKSSTNRPQRREFRDTMNVNGPDPLVLHRRRPTGGNHYDGDPEREACQTRFHLHVRVSVSVGVRQVETA